MVKYISDNKALTLQNQILKSKYDRQNSNYTYKSFISWDQNRQYVHLLVFYHSTENFDIASPDKISFSFKNNPIEQTIVVALVCCALFWNVICYSLEIDTIILDFQKLQKSLNIHNNNQLKSFQFIVDKAYRTLDKSIKNLKISDLILRDYCVKSINNNLTPDYSKIKSKYSNNNEKVPSQKISTPVKNPDSSEYKNLENSDQTFPSELSPNITDPEDVERNKKIRDIIEKVIPTKNKKEKQGNKLA